MRNKFLSLAVFMAAVGTLAAAELLVNPDFGVGQTGGTPAGWNLIEAGGVGGSMTVASESGARHLSVVNRSEKAPNVYLALSQNYAAHPGVEYRLRGRIRGAGSVQFCLGKGWFSRYTATAAGPDWQEFESVYVLSAEEVDADGTAPFLILTDSPVAGVDLAALSLTPARDSLQYNDNAVLNGSYEEGTENGVPDHWQFSSNGADATMRISSQFAVTGSRSLFISSNSQNAPNVYAALQQKLPLEAGKAYELSGQIRGRNAARLLFALGNGWNTRFRTERPGEAWTKFSYQFTLTEEQVASGAPLVIVVDDLTEELYLDDLRVGEAGRRILAPADQPRAGFWRILPLTPAGREIAAGIPAGFPTALLPATAANCADGVLPPADQLSSHLSVAYDPEGLWFFAEVTDATFQFRNGAEMWRGDSLQIRLDQSGSASPFPQETDLEFGLAADADGNIHNWSWTREGELPASETRMIGSRNATGWNVAARLNWPLLADMDYPNRKSFTLNAVLNDSHAPGHRAVYFLAPGLHDVKSAEHYPRAIFVEPGRTVLDHTLAEATAADAFTGQLFGTGFLTAARIEARLRDANGKVQVVLLTQLPEISSDDLVIVDYHLALEEYAEGEMQVEFLVDGTPASSFSGNHADPVKLARASLEAMLARLASLRDRAGAIDNPSKYITLPLAVLQDFLPPLAERMAGFENDRAALLLFAARIRMIEAECVEMLDRITRNLDAVDVGYEFPATWELGAGPVTLADGWPVAASQSSNGDTAVRPVVFDGYGHFFTVLRESLDAFPSYGVNIVQLENGPRSIFPHEGTVTELEPDFTAFERDFLPIIEQCSRNHLRMCILISPHYAPAWWLEKHPEVLLDSGFMKYDLSHPLARDLMRAHIEAFVGRLRDLDCAEIIHSICVLNEPIYTPPLAHEPSQKSFVTWLTREYGPVAAFNQAAGRSFADYDALLAAGPADKTVYAEWTRFRAAEMGDFAQFLSDEVRRVWPGMPVHAKIMIMNSLFADHAIEPERFARLSDYNGNDNYANFKEGGFYSDWLQIAIGDELQYSMMPVSVVNSENHIIRDNETRPIPNDHIYAANFMQHLTGASALITWVWEPYSPEKVEDYVTDLRGGIALRPGNVAAHGLAHLDAMRLAPELRRFTATEPEIGFLYSPSSLRFAPDTSRTGLYRYYTAGAMTGHRIRFISEKQLAADATGNLKMILAAGMPHLDSCAAAGLRRFQERGGIVAADRFSLQRNQLDQPLELGFEPELLPDHLTPAEMDRDFLSRAAQLPVSLTVVDGSVASGVFFRVVPGETDGQYLAVVVNYNADPVQLKLSGGVWRDRLSETDQPLEFELPPLGIRLLESTRL